MSECQNMGGNCHGLPRKLHNYHFYQSFLHWNCRGIFPKFEVLTRKITDHQHKAVCFQKLNYATEKFFKHLGTGGLSRPSILELMIKREKGGGNSDSRICTVHLDSIRLSCVRWQLEYTKSKRFPTVKMTTYIVPINFLWKFLGQKQKVMQNKIINCN